jgi:hypothetical protein
MFNPALIDRFKIFLAVAIGLLLAVFLGKEIAVGNYINLSIEIGTLLIVALASFLGGYYWILTIASSFLAGTFPALQGNFTPFHFFVAVGVAKFLIADVVLKRTKLTMGSRFDAFMIMAFMSILILHGVHDRFGMRFFGSDIWGGKYYVNVLVGLAAYCVIQSAPIKPKIWSVLPYAILAVVTFDLMIALITTIFPRSIYLIYPFYSAVSQVGMEDIFRVKDLDVSERIRAFGNFGVIVTMLVFASCSIRQLFAPSNWLRALAVLIGLATALYSGFRTSVIHTGLTWCFVGLRDLRWMALLLLPVLAAGLLALSFINSDVAPLPIQMQRALSFVPGKWDSEATWEAGASNDFRAHTWSIWQQEYFPEHRWFGRGFGFRSQWAQQSIYIHPAQDYQRYVEVGDIHNGLFASLDAFGITGAIFFVTWNLGLLVRIFRRTEAGKDTTALRFVGLCLAVFVVSFWGGALNLGTFLPQEFALAAVFLRLQRELTLKPVPVHSHRSGDVSPIRDQLVHA